MMPIPVVAHADTGGPLTMAESGDRLTEVGIDEQDDDATPSQEIISPPAEWAWAETTSCRYATAIIDSFPTDGPLPGNGRNPWLCSKEVKLACAHRLGCITEDDYRQGREILARRHTEILETTERPGNRKSSNSATRKNSVSMPASASRVIRCSMTGWRPRCASPTPAASSTSSM